MMAAMAMAHVELTLNKQGLSRYGTHSGKAYENVEGDGEAKDIQASGKKLENVDNEGSDAETVVDQAKEMEEPRSFDAEENNGVNDQRRIQRTKANRKKKQRQRKNRNQAKQADE